MGYFGASEADSYGGNGGTDFFFLKNNGDKAQIRFCYNDMDDVKGLALHEVEVGGKTRYVSCLRNAGDPLDVCPLCEAGYSQKAKVFIPIYDVDADTIKIWERGKSYLKDLSNLIAYNNPLVSTVFEMTRQGKPGDNKTKYPVYPLGTDDIRIEDLPEIPEVLGGLVLDKDAEEMAQYLATGNFPMDDTEQQAPPASARRDVARDARPAARPTAASTSRAVRRPAPRPAARPTAQTKEGKF